MLTINTGQITAKCRDACLNRVNILTVLLAVLVYAGSAYMVSISDSAYMVLQVAVSYYFVLLGVMLMKPHFYVEFIQQAHDAQFNQIGDSGETAFRLRTVSVRKR